MAVTRPLDNILAAVDKMGSARLEIDEEAANVRVGARVLARIDLHRDELLVNAPLQNAFPSARRAASGLVFDIADSRNEPNAVAALHRRVKVEQLAWQVRVGSPQPYRPERPAPGTLRAVAAHVEAHADPELREARRGLIEQHGNCIRRPLGTVDLDPHRPALEGGGTGARGSRRQRSPRR